LSVHPFVCSSFCLFILLSVHPFVCSSFCLFILLSVHPLVHLIMSVDPFESYVCLSVCSSVFLYIICLCVCPSVRLSVFLSCPYAHCLSICTSIFLSVLLPNCLSICLSICLHVQLSNHPFTHISIKFCPFLSGYQSLSFIYTCLLNFFFSQHLLCLPSYLYISYVYMYVHLSICPSVHLSICPYTHNYPSVCLRFFLSVRLCHVHPYPQFLLQSPTQANI
jgi:hypothetical protein